MKTHSADESLILAPACFLDQRRVPDPGNLTVAPDATKLASPPGLINGRSCGPPGDVKPVKRGELESVDRKRAALPSRVQRFECRRAPHRSNR